MTICLPTFSGIFLLSNPLALNLGCELNESNKQEFFKTDDTNHQHQLALRTVSSITVTQSSVTCVQMKSIFF